jgi:energy-coupling factor transporter transmembrane protein EcfT
MKPALENMTSFIHSLAVSARLRNGMLSILALAFVLQLYFVRELLVAELFFGVAFIALLLLGGLFYVIGAVTERSFDWSEVGVRLLASSARRGYAALEEISRKPFRHPRSESAQ